MALRFNAPLGSGIALKPKTGTGTSLVGIMSVQFHRAVAPTFLYVYEPVERFFLAPNVEKEDKAGVYKTFLNLPFIVCFKLVWCVQERMPL